jgi:hypothetical protein
MMVEIKPADKPAMVSIEAGERPFLCWEVMS